MHPNGNGAPPLPPIPLAGDHAGADPYDALADLFLGDGVAPSRTPELRPSNGSPTAAPAPHATIECILLGHLPVLGAPWASQYARSLAQTSGEPVALVTVRGGHLTIEVIGATDAQGGPSSDPAEAVRRAARAASRWLVRVDEGVESLAASPGTSAITLLTAADQASIVGSYAALKRVLDAAGPGQRTVRLAIMAAAPDAADAAYTRLAEAVRSFGGRAVERAPGAQRITAAGPGAVLFSGNASLDAAALVSMIGGASRGSVKPKAQPGPRPLPSLEPETVPSALQPAAAVPITAAILAAAAPPEPAAPMSLASFVPGFEPVAVRCPYAPEVEFASGTTAGTRSLHLLVRAGPGAFEALAAAAAWTRAHAALLRAAGVPAAGEAEPDRHIFVEDAQSVRRLLETGARVHFLAPAAEAARTGWFCRPLN